MMTRPQVILSLSIGAANPASPTPPTAVTPAPYNVMNELRKAEVVQREDGFSGFDLYFQPTRPATGDYDAFTGNLLEPGARVVISVALNAVPHVLIDGVIEQRTYTPRSGKTPDLLVVRGRDLTLAMQQTVRAMAFPMMTDSQIVTGVLATYASLFTPQITTTAATISDQANEVAQCQVTTDLEYVRALARRNGFVFRVIPGATPGTNTAYWGPVAPALAVMPTPLTVNQMPGTNVASMRFGFTPMAAEKLIGTVQDTLVADTDVPFTPLPTPPTLAAAAADASAGWQQVRYLVPTGLDAMQAQAESQGQSDRSGDSVLTATGKLDVFVYQDVLIAPGLVELRGVGSSHDGKYRVAEVTHSITPLQYEQSFTLAREGLGTTVTTVQAGI